MSVRQPAIPVVAITVLVFALAGCGGDDAPGEESTPATGVYIESIKPSSATIGTELTIKGGGFDSAANDVAFILEGSQRSEPAFHSGVRSPDGETLRFALEDTLGVCAMSRLREGSECPAEGFSLAIGEMSISVYNRDGISNSVSFTREPSPIEIARKEVGASPEYESLLEMLGGLVNFSYNASTGLYQKTFSVGFRESPGGDVNIDLTIRGVSADELPQPIPDEVAGYEVRLTEQ